MDYGLKDLEEVLHALGADVETLNDDAKYVVCLLENLPWTEARPWSGPRSPAQKRLHSRGTTTQSRSTRPSRLTAQSPA